MRQTAHAKIEYVQAQRSIRLLHRLQHLPISVVLSAAAVFLSLVAYAAIFWTVKPVVFSYAGDTCIRYPLLFPDIHRINGDSMYEVYATDRIAIGSVTLVSASLCFTPTSAPAEGRSTITIAPLGGVMAMKTFSIQTPLPPLVNTENLARPLPVSKHLTIDLLGPDKVFSYVLEVDRKPVNCESRGSQLLCDVKVLNLKQGASYNLRLERYFKDRHIATLVDQSIATLSATTVTDSTIKPGEQVYTKPRAVDVVLDKKIVNAEVDFYRLENNQKVALPSTATVTDRGIKVEMGGGDLPRQTDFELVISSIEAVDGSGLAEPYVIPFKTSGGPKVTGITIGRTGASLGTTAVVSFDQPLSEDQDIGTVMSLTGGAGVVSKKGSQVSISLKSVPKCGDFGIRISDTLQSNYGIAGGNAWSFNGRMVCHTIETIGYSSRGRPINAYFFGSGPRTVMYTGAIHGSEIGTKYLMDRWIQDLEANARSIPGDKTVVVVPQINPDGVASGSRVNARNVDLNRNFATSDWQKDITDVNNNPFPGGGGQSPMSEPETRAIAALAQRLRPIMIASYHSIGGVVAGNQAGGSDSMAATYSQLSGYQNVTGSTADTFDYSVTGTADDWYASVGIPSLLVELGSHTSAQFERNQKAMWRIVNL